MSVITLLTDWQNDDYYRGIINGIILSTIPDATLVDISHSIPSHNILLAGFILRSCFNDFPEDSIHISAIRSDTSNGWIAARYNNRFILSADNGLFSIISEKEPEQMVKIDTNIESSTFPEKDILIPAACEIAKGKPLDELGSAVSGICQISNFYPVVDKISITGTIIYIDSFGNAITNISRETFDKVCNNRKFEIFPGSTRHAIRTISETYSKAPKEEILAVFNSLGLLELAFRDGSIHQLFKLETKSNIRILFYDT